MKKGYGVTNYDWGVAGYSLEYGMSGGNEREVEKIVIIAQKIENSIP